MSARSGSGIGDSKEAPAVQECRGGALLRVLAVATWAYLVWLVLTWTATVEVFVAGALVAFATGLVLAPLGGIPGPWLLLSPRRTGAILRLGAWVVPHVLLAGARLVVRLWSVHASPRSGMVIVDTCAEGDGELATVGVLTSLVVDSQLVDVARTDGELQYHVLEVPPGGADGARHAVNGPVEVRLPHSRGRKASAP